MDSRHDRAVAKLADHMRQFFARKQPFRIFHGSTNTTRVRRLKADQALDISSLNRVLSVDATKQTVIAEPNVPMDALVQATLQHGFVPPVVMEFPGITVGGGIQGNGGESSSFKWGTFNQTCNWYEVLLADGQVVRASAEAHSELFYAIPGSAGTIGVITAAEIQLVPAQPYVAVTYTPVSSFADAVRTTNDMRKQDVDFVDGIMFAADSGVIISGRMVADAPGKVRRFSRAHDEWYYLHVQNSLEQAPAGWTETVPLTDYLFRYDRGGFWVGKLAFTLFHVPYTRFIRWLLDPMLHTRKLYQALNESGASQQHIVQDLVLPKRAAAAFMEYVDRELAIYPLWLCPMLPDKQAPFQLNNIDTDVIMNVGVWGAHITDYEAFKAANRGIEQRVLAVGGKKWSYAYSYFTREEFWSMYDKPAYDKIRAAYHATYVPDIYDKLTVKRQAPIARKKAALKTLFGLARLRIEK